MRISDWSSDVCSSDLIAANDGYWIAAGQPSIRTSQETHPCSVPRHPRRLNLDLMKLGSQRAKQSVNGPSDDRTVVFVTLSVPLPTVKPLGRHSPGTIVPVGSQVWFAPDPRKETRRSARQ